MIMIRVVIVERRSSGIVYAVAVVIVGIVVGS